MATKFSPCKGSYVLNQFPSNVMFGMNGFHVSASGAIQGHHGPLVILFRLSPFLHSFNSGNHGKDTKDHFSYFPVKMSKKNGPFLHVLEQSPFFLHFRSK